jgi:SAM-dependent methyltransferase
MAEIDLLRRYPKAKRCISARASAKTPENLTKALAFEFDYFDGSRETGYGGYFYDGRWIPIAEDFVRHYRLNASSRVLDVGAAKGFLMRDLMSVCPGIQVFGIDISAYALSNAESACKGRLCRATAQSLPFADKEFDLAISINTLHNLDENDCITALGEIQRVAKKAYVQVDSWCNEVQRNLFLEWMLTAKTYGEPEYWYRLFAAAGYTGDYYWTITE